MLLHLPADALLHAYRDTAAWTGIDDEEIWDALVARAVTHGWAGIEALSGIPGAVGSTPIQNVGAYGQDVSQTIARVRVWDRVLRGVRTFAASECQFGYRSSRFKADPGRHVVNVRAMYARVTADC